MKWLNFIVIVVLILLQNSVSYAGFATSASRIIYTEGERERSLIVSNINEYPILAQTWVDDGQGNPDQAKAPFVVLPAVFKMNPKGIQALRIVHNSETMPQDRESVFWLNLYEIPGKTQEQMKPLEEGQARLDLAMNTQLKIFYRPKKLPKMDLQQIVQQLHFSIQQQQGQWFVECQNPAPYHVSFTGIALVQEQQRIAVMQDMDMMTPALGQKIYMLPKDTSLTQLNKIEFSLLGDDGQSYTGYFDQQTGKSYLNMQ